MDQQADVLGNEGDWDGSACRGRKKVYYSTWRCSKTWQRGLHVPNATWVLTIGPAFFHGSSKRLGHGDRLGDDGSRDGNNSHMYQVQWAGAK